MVTLAGPNRLGHGTCNNLPGMSPLPANHDTEHRPLTSLTGVYEPREGKRVRIPIPFGLFRSLASFLEFPFASRFLGLPTLGPQLPPASCNPPEGILARNPRLRLR